MGSCKPDVEHLRVFGCDAYVQVPDGQRSKLDAKSKRCIFLGYCHDQGSKAYRLYDPETRRFIASRNVLFDESNMTHIGRPRVLDEVVVVEGRLPGVPTDSERPGDAPLAPERPAAADAPPAPVRPAAADAPPAPVPAAAAGAAPDLDTDVAEDHDSDVESLVNEESHSKRYPQRVRNPVGKWWTVQKRQSTALVANVRAEEPASLGEALQRADADEWRKAVEDELQAIRDNDVYELAELPPGRKAIGCKYVFKIKRNADGSVERYKARLVAKGFSQTEGVDFNETFAPVAKFNSIRAILAIAAAEGATVHQLVKTAFLNGDLDEEIYMKQPEGTVEEGKEHLVWRLRKALYGLKQAPRMWYNKLHLHLLSFGFVRREGDHSVYVKRDATSGRSVIVAVYVDDLLLVGPASAVAEVKRVLMQMFNMTDLGEAHWLLGIEITRDSNGIHLSQAQYIRDVLERYGMSDCKPVGTPLDVNTRLSEQMSPATEGEREAMAAVPYRSFFFILLIPD